MFKPLPDKPDHPSLELEILGTEDDMGPLIARLNKSVVQQLRELGVNVIEILGVIDREEGAATNIAAAG